MIKQEENKMLDRIEKLIVDGNKEVIDRVDEKLEAVKQELRQEILGVEGRLGKDIKDLKFQGKMLDASIKAVQYDVKELDKKFDVHVKVLHGV